MKEICPYCEEAIEAGDITIPVQLNGTPARHHRECVVRMTIGSLGHMKKRCRCYGGNEHDPPGMTLRQGARAAFEYLNRGSVVVGGARRGKLDNIDGALRVALAHALEEPGIDTEHYVRAGMEAAAKLRSRVQRLEEWIADLQSGMFINCVYCGHRYGPDPGTPVAMAEVLRRHVEQCPEHPMSKLRAQLLRNRQGYVNILEMRKLNSEKWGQRDGYGGRYGALTREEIEQVIADIDAALA